MHVPSVVAIALLATSSVLATPLRADGPRSVHYSDGSHVQSSYESEPHQGSYSHAHRGDIRVDRRSRSGPREGGRRKGRGGNGRKRGGGPHHRGGQAPQETGQQSEDQGSGNTLQDRSFTEQVDIPSQDPSSISHLDASPDSITSGNSGERQRNHRGKHHHDDEHKEGPQDTEHLEDHHTAKSKGHRQQKFHRKNRKAQKARLDSGEELDEVPHSHHHGSQKSKKNSKYAGGEVHEGPSRKNKSRKGHGADKEVDASEPEREHSHGSGRTHAHEEGHEGEHRHSHPEPDVQARWLEIDELD